ncbi:MAG: VCBS repeat-containing protein [Acidobacteria bacterium]|nr:VCBS repeat-containing protein [Acidobacteriota bacterium]
MRLAIRSAAAAAILTLALSSGALRAGEPILWVEDSFEDFADGKLDAAGHNLYVSRDGALRTIHRFDLNRDGYLDLIFNSTHDNFTYIPATLGLMEPSRRVRRAELAVEGSLGVVLEDLNRDGHLDALFCPNRSGLQNPRRLLTILWGSEDGWSNQRSHGQLPVHGALAVAAADLDRDGWPDIVTLNQAAWLPGQPEGNILRIFWGSPEGFLLTDTTELGIPQALDLAAGDFDGDGFKEAALLSGRGLVEIVRGRAAPGATRELIRQEMVLPGDEGLCLTAADADGDSRIDLLVGTDRGKVYFVGGKAGPGWGEPGAWAAPNASHIAVGYLNGDGHPDLVLTDFTLARAGGGEAAGAAESVAEPVQILWGSTDGFDSGRSTGLAIAYARSSAVGDLDGDGHQDLSVAVHQSSKQFETDSLVFLGTGSSVLDQHPLTLRTLGATDTAIVPPRGSLPGRVLFCNSLGGSVAERVPLYVYWGGSGGFSASNRWEIPFQSGYEASAADLNRDGYLDLVLGAFEAKEGKNFLVIRYGSKDGFLPADRLALPFDYRTVGSLVADLNGDDWLDTAFVSSQQNRLHILWGGPEGFSPERHSQLRIPFPISLETADFNGDGQLDLAVGSYMDPVSHHHDMGLSIFWGDRGEFRPSNAQWLPGFTPIGIAAADFDGDGYLDLFSPHYLGELTRESVASYLYWGGPQGFETRNRTILITDSAHDSMAGDFDQDGRLDLAVSCHTRDGNHHTDSKVFYNDGNRFRNPRVEHLPTIGTHWMWIQDVGHIHHRQWKQVYGSSVFAWDREVSAGRLTFRAEQPKGTGLSFQVRSSADSKGLANQAWRPLRDGAFDLSPADRRLQYRAVLESGNGDLFPVLDRVEIQLE